MKKLPPLKIAVVGEPLAGKDTISTYLTERYGFVHISTGDFVRFYILENDLGEPTRPRMHEVANFLRTEHGPEYFAKLALRDPASHMIISGLRNPHEVQAVKDAGGYALAVTVSAEMRFKRLKERGRIGDDLTFAEFTAQEQAEETSTNPNAQNMAEVLALADVIISNDSTVEQLETRIEEALSEIVKLASKQA